MSIGLMIVSNITTVVKTRSDAISQELDLVRWLWVGLGVELCTVVTDKSVKGDVIWLHTSTSKTWL